MQYPVYEISNICVQKEGGIICLGVYLEEITVILRMMMTYLMCSFTISDEDIGFPYEFSTPSNLNIEHDTRNVSNESHLTDRLSTNLNPQYILMIPLEM